jgi:hypothetical protein
LNHSPADIVSRLLIELGLGNTPNVLDPASIVWPVHVSQEPDRPDNVITVQDTAGRDRGRTFDGERQELPGIQVRVRSKTHTVGWSKVDGIKTALDEVFREGVSIGSYRYLIWSIRRTGPPLRLGKQKPENELDLFTVNALVNLEQL